MNTFIYNPYHGCHKYSEGCQNCYVYRRDEQIGKDASLITKTSSFFMPIAKDRQGNYKIPSGSTVYCVMTSDFFLEEADLWRPKIWEMIHQRSDVSFIIITKRIVRFHECLPEDWQDGYDNVTIISTIESQRQADIRMPILLSIKAKHKQINCEPLLTDIDFKDYLSDGQIEKVTVGGESGDTARNCDYNWVLHIRDQAIAHQIPFHFKQTGTHFIKNGHLYTIERKFQQSQAAKANIDINF